MIIIGLDPGPEKSALVGISTADGFPIIDSYQILPNEDAIVFLERDEIWHHLVIEKIESMGMAVGRSTFDTVFFTGRLYQALIGNFKDSISFISRREVKLHLCNSMRAKDANIRQVLIDRFPATGGGKVSQIGTKKQPGELYGIKADMWAALAVAITWYEKHSP